MRIVIEDDSHGRSGKYPPGVIAFQILSGENFYANTGYSYSFWPTGECHVDRLSQQIAPQGSGQRRPNRKEPLPPTPVELRLLTRALFKTKVIGNSSVHDGKILPLSFLNPKELLIVRELSVTEKTAEDAALKVIADYFEVRRLDISVRFS